MLPLTRSGTAISLVLDLFLAGMVAHGIVHVERQLAARSNFVRSILASSTELAMVALLLQKETVAPLTTFLVGLVYAKLFVVGGLCLLLCGLNSAPDRDRCTSEWLLALCGAIVFAARSSAEGQSQPAASTALLLLLIHVGFVYYAAESDSSDLSAEQSRQGPLLFVLIVLRTAAIGLGYRILEQLETLPGSLLPNETIVYLVFLPLLTIAMDQSSTIKRRVTGRRVEQWSDIIQTVSFTYFFVRPLATLVRSEFDPTGGRKPLALCLIVASAWMKISKVPLYAKGLADVEHRILQA
ncbi:hypothetical protein E8E11_007420 [Didymella keratinophila]|nr:hypothetical protein E8E11_007420 [Didymella keratinophila]